MSSSYRNSLNEWLNQLEVKAHSVLDIGGAQEQLPPRVKSWDVKNYVISDLEEPHKDSPKPDIVMDINLPYIGTEHFDMIFCLEVFDYVYDPMTAMKNIYKLLWADGTAWVSFPSIYPLHQPVEDDALRYMPAGIVKLAEAVGFTVEQMIKRRPETDLWDQFYRAERMRAAKHEDHAFTGFIVELKK